MATTDQLRQRFFAGSAVVVTIQPMDVAILHASAVFETGLSLCLRCEILAI